MMQLAMLPAAVLGGMSLQCSILFNSSMTQQVLCTDLHSTAAWTPGLADIYLCGAGQRSACSEEQCTRLAAALEQ